MFDGQNVFGDEGSFAGGWHADDAVTRMTAKDAPVIVAIDHGGSERIAELGAISPKADAFADFVVTRALPAARARLALREEPAGCIACGSSMGGLFAFYMHFRRPEIFGGAIAMSPSLWFGARSVIEFVSKQSNPYRSRVYLDAGAREGRGRLGPLVESVGASLRARGWSASNTGDLRVTTRVDPRGAHDEKSWARRLPKALRFAFGP
jgi:predicted alpha/beta superfamily hydrolase